jgi:hypothetical protein
MDISFVSESSDEEMASLWQEGMSTEGDEGALVLFHGSLWKKTPKLARKLDTGIRMFHVPIRKFQLRYITLSFGCLSWSDRFKRLGRVDFNRNDCVVSEVAGSTTEFEIRPSGGAWKEGDFTGAASGRVLVFDAKDSEHDRSRWMEVISLHISHAKKKERMRIERSSLPPFFQDVIS